MIKLVQHREDWKDEFENIRKSILDNAKDIVVTVDHIGSTAIPGIVAKDIIDVQVGIRTFEDIEGLSEILEGIGFEYLPDIKQDHAPGHEFDEFIPGWEKRFFKTRRGRPSHLHIRLVTGQNFRFALLFRDFLRNNKEAARAYEQFKVRLADAVGGDMKKYALTKDPVCDLIVLLARGSMDAGA